MTMLANVSEGAARTIEALAPDPVSVPLEKDRWQSGKLMGHLQEPGDKDALIAELRAAIAARDEFIAVAAHELRNPMTPVLIQVQLLLMRANKNGALPEMVSGLERLETGVLLYIRRATSLLEISRINAGQLQLSRSMCDVSEIINDTV